MQFNSYFFIMCFLPLIVVLNFSVGKLNSYVRKIILIAGSVFFYTYIDFKVFAVLGISLAVNFIFIKIVEKQTLKKWFLAVPVVANVLLLLYFKYLNFAITNINTLFSKEFPLKELVAPIGISFFTFSQIAYVVAVSRKEISKADILDYLSYILFFPKLLMGPIMDPVDFNNQLNDENLRFVDWNNIASGLKIFSLGLLKKVLIADTFAKAVSWGFSNFDAPTSVDWLLIMLFYTFEIYFDFSGYSDMAVGTSLMLNIKLPINFDSPYKAVSIRDFWKRWHISLTRFFTKYVYIPLGGNQKGAVFTCINTMIVFVVSGIWHGSNWTFILWGVIHGAFCLVDRFIEKKSIRIFEPVRWIITFGITNVLWLLFRSDSINQWTTIIKKIVSCQNTAISDALINNFILPEYKLLLNLIGKLGEISSKIHGFWMFIFIIISAFICFFPENNYKNQKKITWVTLVVSIIAMVWSITCLSGESVFVYFNF